MPLNDDRRREPRPHRGRVRRRGFGHEQPEQPRDARDVAGPRDVVDDRVVPESAGRSQLDHRHGVHPVRDRPEHRPLRGGDKRVVVSRPRGGLRPRGNRRLQRSRLLRAHSEHRHELPDDVVRRPGPHQPRDQVRSLESRCAARALVCNDDPAVRLRRDDGEERCQSRG